MPKKRQLTEEQKQVLRDRLTRARAAKQAHNTDLPDSATTKPAPNAEVEAKPPIEAPEEPRTAKIDPAPVEDVNPEPDMQQLMATIAEAMKILANNQTGQAPATSANGIIGTTDKYSINSADYPDPTARLADEPKLARFAFKDNYELNYEFSTTEYKTIDNLRFREPKFTLELIRKLFDETTGELTNGRYIICRLVMHEDPDTALIMARQMGYVIEDAAEKSFLDEMRYLRMRDWLVRCFLPSPIKDNSRRKEVVIDGKLVEYFEVNAEKNAAIPFNQLGSKL